MKLQLVPSHCCVETVTVPQLIHSNDGHLSSFQFGATINNASEYSCKSFDEHIYPFMPTHSFKHWNSSYENSRYSFSFKTKTKTKALTTLGPHFLITTLD